jgi:hypothetical protein
VGDRDISNPPDHGLAVEQDPRNVSIGGDWLGMLKLATFEVLALVRTPSIE